MTPKRAPQEEAVASSASDSANEVPSSPEVIETEDTKSAAESSPSGVSNIMENNSLVPIARLAQIDEGAGQGSSQDYTPREMAPGEPGYIPREMAPPGPPGEGGGRKAGTGRPLSPTDDGPELVFVALINDDPARQPIISPEDITTTVDIDFHAVQMDIPIEQMAAMPDRWQENDRNRVTVWMMRLPIAGKAFLIEEGEIYVQTKLGETTRTVRDCDSEGNQNIFSPIQDALNAGRQEKTTAN